MILGHIGAGAGLPDTGDIEKSLRFAASRSTYLTTPSANKGNSTTYTYSCWVKLGLLGAVRELFSIFYDVNNQGIIFFDASNRLTVYSAYQGVVQITKVSNAVFRDPTSWYHVVVVIDSSQAVASDRCKMFVNGSQITLFDNNVMALAQNAITPLSFYYLSTWYTRIGNDIAGNLLDGYLARVCVVDGVALTPDSFGYFNTEINEWVTKSQSAVKAVADAGGAGSFMLDFDDGTSLTTLGYDKSSKGNNWTLNNFSLTPGVNYDWMDDVPGNSFAVLNPLIYDSLANVPSAGNLAVTLGNASNGRLNWATQGMRTGKWYAEFTIVTVSTSGHYCGVTTHALTTGTSRNTGNTYIGDKVGEFSYGRVGSSASRYSNGTAANTGTTLPVAGDIVGLAFDADAGTLAVTLNGVSQSISGLTGIPADEYFFGVSAAGFSWAANFGQRPFAYTPPTGFKALCQRNLDAAGTITVSGTFTGNAAVNGPFVWMNGSPNTLSINGNAVTFGTHADRLANGFKVRTTSASYNTVGSNTWTATISSDLQNIFKYNNAKDNS